MWLLRLIVYLLLVAVHIELSNWVGGRGRRRGEGEEKRREGGGYGHLMLSVVCPVAIPLVGRVPRNSLLKNPHCVCIGSGVGIGGGRIRLRLNRRNAPDADVLRIQEQIIRSTKSHWTLL